MGLRRGSMSDLWSLVVEYGWEVEGKRTIDAAYVCWRRVVGHSLF